MKKRMLSEIEKKQLLLNKLRQIIREEIERSTIFEADPKTSGTISLQIPSWYQRLLRRKKVLTSIIEIYKNKKQSFLRSPINNIIELSLHDFLTANGFPNISNFNFDENKIKLFTQRLYKAFASTRKESYEIYKNDVSFILQSFYNATTKRFTPFLENQLKNEKERIGLSYENDNLLNSFIEAENNVLESLKNFEEKFNYLLLHGSGLNHPNNDFFIDMGQPFNPRNL